MHKTLSAVFLKMQSPLKPMVKPLDKFMQLSAKVVLLMKKNCEAQNVLLIKKNPANHLTSKLDFFFVPRLYFQFMTMFVNCKIQNA